MIDKIKEALEKHRKEAFITCDENCLCWDVEAILDSEVVKKK